MTIQLFENILDIVRTKLNFTSGCFYFLSIALFSKDNSSVRISSNGIFANNFFDSEYKYLEILISHTKVKYNLQYFQKNILFTNSTNAFKILINIT